jgi:integrase
MGLNGLDPASIAEEFRDPLIRLTSSWTASIASSTLTSRRCDLRRFAQWCNRKDQLPLASSCALSELMESHVTDVGQTLSAGSMQCVGAALSALAKALNSDQASRGAQERRRLAVRAAQRSVIPTGKTHLKLRLTVPEMQTMRGSIETEAASSLRAVRDLAIFDTICDVLARRSEIKQMLGRDLDILAGTIRITYSKTDQAGRGSIFSISPRTVASIEAWLGASGLRDIDVEDAGALPVFVGIMNDGKIRLAADGQPDPMDGRTVARALQRYAVPLGFSGVAGHSLRRSIARALYEADVPEEEIVRKGRWSSLDQMRNYVGMTAPIQGAISLIL